jgi:hypothetical protein
MSETIDQSIPSARQILERIPWLVVVLCGVLLGLSFVGRVFFDILVPTTDYGPRSSVTTWVGLGICFAAGFAGASWGRRFHQGILAVFATILAGFVLAILGGLVSVMGLSMVRAIDFSRNMAEALDVPLPVMLVVGGAVGTIGAGLATRLSHRPRHYLNGN